MSDRIPVRQYLRPSGDVRTGGFERPDEIVALSRRIRAAGYRFEAEVLTTGDVSLSIVGPDPGNDGEEGDVAIRVVPNGPQVTEAFDEMVAEFASTLGGAA